MNFTGQLFTPTPPTSYIGRFSVSPEQLPYISEHTTFLFAELDAHNSFQIRADEILPKDETVCVVGSEQGIRESAPLPKCRHRICLGFNLKHIHRIQFNVFDTPGQTLPRFPEQVHRRRTQDEEPASAPSPAAPLVDETAQVLKQLRYPVNLVENDKAVFISSQEEYGIDQLLAIRPRLEIQVYPPPSGRASARVVLPTCRAPIRATAA